MTEIKLQPPNQSEQELLVDEMRQVGPEIAHFTAGHNDVALPNSTSAFVPYSEDGRLTLIRKEEGAEKIGPEFVIQDQYVEEGRVKSLSFSWPENYPEDKNTWRVTRVDTSLPQREKRKDTYGAGLRADDISQALALVRKTRKALGV